MRPACVPTGKKKPQQTVTRADIFVCLLLSALHILFYLMHIVYEVYTTVDPVYMGEDIDMKISNLSKRHIIVQEYRPRPGRLWTTEQRTSKQVWKGIWGPLSSPPLLPRIKRPTKMPILRLESSVPGRYPRYPLMLVPEPICWEFLLNVVDWLIDFF